MIELVGVSTSDSSFPHLNACSLRSDAKQIHALVGPRSSGKTLLLDVAVGLHRPTRGVCQVLGFDSAVDRDAVRQRITYVPRGGLTDSTMSLFAHIMWVLRLLGARPTPLDIRRALRNAEVPDRYFDCAHRETPPECRVLAGLAVASLRGHRVVLLDDPGHGLSPLATKHVARVLEQWRAAGACLLVTCRDQHFAEGLADVVTAIEDGRTTAPRTIERTSQPAQATPDLLGRR